MKVIFLILIGISSLSFAAFSKQNGVVTDSSTKLEWQDNYSDNGGDVKSATWKDAIDYCEALSLDGGGWRLPNIRELESLVDDTKINPSINGIFEFINSLIYYHYWSASTVLDRSYAAWIIRFDYGYVDNGGKNIDYYHVRCVRAREQ